MVTTATSWFGARNKHSQHNAGKDRTWPRHARRKGGVDAQTPHDCSARLGQCQESDKGPYNSTTTVSPCEATAPPRRRWAAPNRGRVCVLRGFLFQRNTDRTAGEPRRDPADDPGSFRGCPPMPRCSTVNVRRGSSYDQAAIVCTF